MANQYVGKITQVKEEGDKLIVFCALVKEGISGALHGHNVRLIFDLKSHFKTFKGDFKKGTDVFLNFGRFFGMLFSKRVKKSRVFGRVGEDIKISDKKSDKVNIPVLQSPLLFVEFEDNVVLNDKFLIKYLKRGKRISVTFF
jgi:hypothetical protein